MKKVLVFAIVASVMWISPPGVGAVDYYVDGTGGNDSWNGLYASYTGDDNGPWETIGKANSTLGAGDTVYIRAGTYANQQIKPSNSGTSGNYITYVNYNNEEVIITGGTAQISMDNKSYIAIDGLKFYHPAHKGQWAYIIHCNHIKFDNCIFDNYDTRRARYPFRVVSSDHFYFTDTTWTMDDVNWEWEDRQEDMVSVFDIKHFLFLRCTLGDASHASFGFERGIDGVGPYVHADGDFLVFKDCIIDNKWRQGIGTWQGQKRLLVDQCTFVKIGVENHQCPWVADRNRLTAAISSATSNSIYRRNVIYEADVPITWCAGDMKGDWHAYDHNWFYSNTIYDTAVSPGNDPTSGAARASGVIIFGGAPYADYPFEYNKFINNICWKIEGSYYGRHLDTYGDGYCRNNIIKHNIFGDPDGTTMMARWSPYGDKTLTEYEQLHGDWISGVGTHYNFDPLMTDPANQDFTLQSNSPAINAGTWLTTIASPTASNQTSIILDDATPFYSGSGSPWFIEGETGDTIKTQNGQITEIQSINYDTNAITVSPAINIVNGEGVALDYEGTAPDIGAFEFTGVVPDPYCGDGSCNGDETCESCPDDCGECPAVPIDRTNWTLLYVDSEETVGEDGAATNSFDGDPGTIWHTKWYGGSDPYPHEIQIDLGDNYIVSGFRYLPRQDSENGRIKDYEFYVSSDGSTWDLAKTGAFVSGAEEQEVLFGDKTGRYISLIAVSAINAAHPWATVAELNVLGTDYSDIEPPSVPQNLQATTVSSSQIDLSWDASTDNSGVVIGYNIWCGGNYLDSTADTSYSDTDLDPDTTYSYTVSAYDAAGNESDVSAPDSATTDPAPSTDPLDRTNWSVHYVDSEQPGNEAEYSFDSDPATFWHTQWSPTAPSHPHEIQIDLGDNYTISGFKYLPRPDEGPGGENGRIADYEFYVSSNGSDWDLAATGIFANTATEKQVTFDEITGSFVSLKALSEVNDEAWTTMAELNVLGEEVTNPPDTPISQDNWTLLYVDSEETVGEDGAAENSFDGDPGTIWHTKWYGGPDPLPHEIQIDLGDNYIISGFRYLPRQDSENGRIANYEFYVSSDGTSWGSAVATGTFDNSTAEQEVTFDVVTGRYVSLIALTEVDGNPWTTVAELNVLGSESSGEGPVSVGNFSFELPGTVKQTNWGNVPNWSSDTVAADSGVEEGWTVTDGTWSGFLKNTDPSVYNLTNHTITAGEVFTLTVDAGTNDTGGVNFEMTLYYDDGGIRVPAATQTVNIPDGNGSDIYEYSMDFTADGVPGSIGYEIGIELDNVDGDLSWMGMDNVRLMFTD